MTALDDVVARFVADTSAFDRPVDRAARNATQFGRTTERAALTVRRAMLTAADAADKAAASQEAAANAAQKFERGQLSAAEAARLAERATRDLERANLVEREAQLAAASAADKAADQYRQMARDAELAAAAERLSSLKAVGAIDEHNKVIQRLRGRYGELEKVGGEAFREIEQTGGVAFRAVQNAGQSAFSGISSAASSLGESGPGAIALVVGALAAVPFAAALAEGAITLGVGGALAGLGLAATKGDAQVQAALHDMTSHIKSETTKIAAPFKSTWLSIAKDGKAAFDSLEPELSRDFAKLAPVVSRFAHEGAVAIGQLSPALHAATDGASKLLDALGPALPDITHNLANAISIMAHSAGENAGAISHMLVAVSDLLPPLAAFLDLTVKLAPAVSPLFDVMTSGLDTLRTFGSGVDWLTGGMTSFGHGLQMAGADFPAFNSGASDASEASGKLAQDMQTLADNTATAADKANALTDAFQRLLDPEKAVFEDSAKLRDKITELTKELKQSHGALNDNSAAARTAKESFTKMLTIAESLASDMLNAGDSLDTVQTKMGPYIAAMYKAAGANKQARQLVDDFVKSLQMVPGGKATHISAPGASAAIGAALGLRQAVNNIPSHKTVLIHAVVTGANLGALAGLGGATGGRYDGRRFHYATGGEVSGLILGPGTGTSDSVPAPWLSNGEFVTRERITRKNLKALMALNAGLSWWQAGILAGKGPAYASGGLAWSPATASFGGTHDTKAPLPRFGGTHDTGKWKWTPEMLASFARIAKAKGRPEYAAAMAAQDQLEAMRRNVYGGFFNGRLPGVGSAHGTVVQHVTTVNVNVQGSIRSDRDIVAMIQQQLLTGRRSVTLPAGR